MSHLTEIEGIAEVYEEKLVAAGIKSVEQLLESCCQKKSGLHYLKKSASVKS